MNARAEMMSLLEALERIQAAYNANPEPCYSKIREAIDASREATSQAREELDAEESE